MHRTYILHQPDPAKPCWKSHAIGPSDIFTAFHDAAMSNSATYILGKDQLPPQVPDIRILVDQPPNNIVAQLEPNGHLWYWGFDDEIVDDTPY